MLLRYYFANLFYILWFILFKSPQANLTIETHNGLIGSPEIKCNPETIELAFRTKKKFRGKVFVKGHYSNPNCRVDYAKAILNSTGSMGSITLSHGQCDMSRQRMIHPEGMQLSTVLIVSFHPLFITKLDKAFHIRCMYREVVREVSSGIEVSAMSTEALEYDYPFPNCMYTIRREEIDGPILKYARVGDQIVHRWECLSDTYGLLVHNCFVEDGQGEKQIIIDEDGCHTDRAVLGDPTYVESLNMAYRESLVFKFADRVIVRFQCQIRLCIKDQGGCIGITPPMCFDEKEKPNKLFIKQNDSGIHHMVKMINFTDFQLQKSRKIRSPISEQKKVMFDTDLISQPVYVLDADDENTDENNDRLRQNILEVCISSTLFAMFICVMVVTLLALITSAIWLMHRWLRSSGMNIIRAST